MTLQAHINCNPFTIIVINWFRKIYISLLQQIHPVVILVKITKIKLFISKVTMKRQKINVI